MWPHKPNPPNDQGKAQVEVLRANFRRIERREWWMWATAAIITLLLTIGLTSFLLPNTAGLHNDFYSVNVLPQALRGLVALVFLFDLYTIYQHLLIYRIRKQLMEREELFHLISENAADMIAVVDMDGKRIYNSLSYQKALGYSAEELKASSAFEQIHPNDRERVMKAAEEARHSGIGKTLEYRIRRKDGMWLVLESTSSVIRNAKGDPEKLVIVNRDITERKKAEEALRRSEAGFRSVVEDAPYGIFRTSITGQFLQVNPALQKMLGYESQAELLKQDLATDIFRHSGEYRRLTETLSGMEDVKDIEMEWKRLDGTPITVRCSGRRVNDENGVPTHFEVFAEDVTEKRVLERQLRMAQKMEAIGRLSGGIAHDFNNLLSVIIGYSRVLTKSLNTNAPLREHALEIEKAGQRAASLTKQLLAFSRQQVLTPAVLNLNTLACDMEKMLPRLLGEDIEVSLDLVPDLGNVKADQSQIEQVIMNLAVNARDAMPEGGKLKIQTSNVELDQAYTWNHPGAKVGSYVLLTVTDTGTGMDAATLTHIFEPFFTTKERGKGTGLGLATVYGVVKQSNGYIWVDSAPGKGASFQIYLPRHIGQPETDEQKSDSGEKLRGSETILLVEDAEPLRKLAQTFLEAVGFRVLSAESGERALEVAAGFGGIFDLLLTDVVMPGMNGRVLAEQLAPRQPGMKILYMSGYTDSFIAGHGVLDPQTHLLHKPFTEEVLLRKVREVLDSGKKPPADSRTVPESKTSEISPSR
ncbi:MAG TPA: PAS domain S-box protein [Candidatus Dormibacteraeota bacterium]|jgi:two-component system cell cycle sensor histidine kinase/response regulator CckA|nr:PAS domain S-box protein [Candidatus Dormibacteraeota bacterium]